MGRFKTKLFEKKEDGYCSCDRGISGGENCRCGSSGYMLYGIFDTKLGRFTRHQKVDYFWKSTLVKTVKDLNCKNKK